MTAVEAEFVPEGAEQPQPAVQGEAERLEGEAERLFKAERLGARLGAARAIEILSNSESKGWCAIEQDSVYGSAIAIPQITRSAGWPRTLRLLTIRTYLLLVMNYLLQGACIYYLYDALGNGARWGEKMHLCDFGAHVGRCPDGANCQGPGGSRIADPGSLYSYDTWRTRQFVRDSLAEILSDRKEEIQTKIKPGEWGLESYYCRALCIFLFVIAVADEWQGILDLFRMMYRVPSNEHPWIVYEVNYGIRTSVKKEATKVGEELSELDLVKFQVKGMPFGWKVINIAFVFIPKLLIWRALSQAGVHFLMETSGITDLLINTTALAFVLSIDELVFDRLSTHATKHLVSNVKPYELPDEEEHKDDRDDRDEAVLRRYDETEFKGHLDIWQNMSTIPLFPRRLLWSMVFMAAFMAEYYYKNCERREDGSIVSKDITFPKGAHEWFYCALVPCNLFENGNPPSWTMPPVHV